MAESAKVYQLHSANAQPQPLHSAQPTTGGGPPEPPVTSAADPNRKFKAKRLNEQLKLLYSALNTVGMAIVLAAAINPAIIGARILSEEDRPGWVLIGLFLHACGHAVIRWGWRKED